MQAIHSRINHLDVTTVYDALQGCDATQLAFSLLGPSGSRPKEEGGLAPVDVAARRASSMLRVVRQLGPNYEESARILLPWRPSHLAVLANLSWPDALGMRIVLPSGIDAASKSRLLAGVLLGMSYAARPAHD